MYEYKGERLLFKKISMIHSNLSLNTRKIKGKIYKLYLYKNTPIFSSNISLTIKVIGIFAIKASVVTARWII